MSAAGSIPDTDSLGEFTDAEIAILRQQQQVIEQQSQASSQRSTSMLPERGRGVSRHSQASSRAASKASSNNSLPERIPIDSPSLTRLQIHLDNLIRNMRARIDQLEDEMDAGVEMSRGNARATAQRVDQEIERLTKIHDEMERIEEKCKEIFRIRNKVAALKKRVDAVGGRMDAVRPKTHARSGR